MEASGERGPVPPGDFSAASTHLPFLRRVMSLGFGSGLNLRHSATPPRCPCVGKSADEFLFFISEAWSTDFAEFRRFWRQHSGAEERRSHTKPRSHKGQIGVHPRFPGRGSWLVPRDPKICPYGHTTNSRLRGLRGEDHLYPVTGGPARLPLWQSRGRRRVGIPRRPRITARNSLCGQGLPSLPPGHQKESRGGTGFAGKRTNLPV